jgi:hypothetical protein
LVNHIWLLKAIYKTIIIPTLIAEELAAANNPAIPAILQLDWIQTRSPTDAAIPNRLRRDRIQLAPVQNDTPSHPWQGRSQHRFPNCQLGLSPCCFYAKWDVTDETISQICDRSPSTIKGYGAIGNPRKGDKR